MTNLKTTLMFLYTESPLHAGVGPSVSVVDLPIQRERATQYPVVQGSGIKGALRSQAEGMDDQKTIVFGPSDTKNGSEHAGAISVGEARLLLFPLRSLSGVFAYATSAFAIARLARDLALCGTTPTWTPISEVEDKALVTTKSKIKVEQNVVLEEFTFPAQEDNNVSVLASWIADHAFPQDDAYRFWRDKVKNSLVVLPENEYRDFAMNSTEIVTRVRIESATKTVTNGALWTQEMLPADTLLYSSIVVRASRKGKEGVLNSSDEIQQWLQMSSQHIQLGGDETTGAGQTVLCWL